MASKPTKIRDLELRLGDREFFYLFNNLSVFNNSPYLRRINMVASITDPHKLLRYSEDPTFYRVCKSPELISNWRKLLDENKNEAGEISGLHPFDELLKRHCEEMSLEAKDDAPLAKAFQEKAAKYSKAEAETVENSRPSP